MGGKTGIEYADATCTPIRARNVETGAVGWHCEHVNPECINCYAEAFNMRLGTGLPFKPGHRNDIEIFLDEDMLSQPMRWRTRPELERPLRIFLCSMTDLFGPFVKLEWIIKILAVVAVCPQHDFLFPTKRPGRCTEVLLDPETPRKMVEWYCEEMDRGSDIGCRLRNMGLPWANGPWPLTNLLCGFTGGTQETFDAGYAAMRPLALAGWPLWCSAEPLLGPIDATGALRDTKPCADCPSPRPAEAIHEDCCRDPEIFCGLAGIATGGESGDKKQNPRPSHPDWFRSLRDDCRSAGAAFYFKQWGDWEPVGWVHADSTGALLRPDGRVCRDRTDLAPSRNMEMRRVGKKRAGALLDGKTYQEWPDLKR